MKKIKINPDRNIGKNEPCFVIVEAGSNHNRSKSLAKKLISSAAEAGADAIKFQLFEGEKHYSRRTPRFKLYDKHIVDLLNEISLPREWVGELNEYAQEQGIIFFSSVTDKEDVDLMKEVGARLYKLASFELVDLDLIRYTAKIGKPVILSTGMATLREIREAHNTCLKTGNNKVVLLQCSSAYPAPYESINLNAMNLIEDKFDVVTGFSDHSLGTHIAIGAVALGAKVIEKHYTVDRKLKGPDHAFSMEPDELKDMVTKIRQLESALGDGKKVGPQEVEMEFYEKARRSLHAEETISKGEVIAESMLTVKRPGYGIKPKHKKDVLGKKAVRKIKKDEWITWDMVG